MPLSILLRRGQGVNRREIMFGAAAAWPPVALPLTAWAQLGTPIRRVGVLMSGLPEDLSGIADVAALRQGLADLGWIEGRNVHIEIRWAGGNVECAQRFAKELVGLKPDALLAPSTPTTAALKSETSAIPIVFVSVVEPIESGFVQTLAWPGGNITGFTNFEISVGGKWVQLLKEVNPQIPRVAIIYNPKTAPYAGLFLRSLQAAASAFAMEIVELTVHSDADIDTALAVFAKPPGGGLIAIPDSFTVAHRDVIIANAVKYRLPALYGASAFTLSGGLMAYAVDTRDTMQRAAGYIHRILKGARPTDLPVQAPVKFMLSINLKTAKALGLELAPTLIARADEVIE
jgi:putative tryptophan/tyrosine transport system substrate-binding protein